MLRFVLLQNRAGKTRLSKYYTKFSEEETRKIEAEVHRIVTQREGANASAMCSFVEVRHHHLAHPAHESPGRMPLAQHPSPSAPREASTPTAEPGAGLTDDFRSQWRNYKLVYRRYAGLFFTMCIDPVDNELSYLEIIHLFVEVRPQFAPSLPRVCGCWLPAAAHADPSPAPLSSASTDTLGTCASWTWCTTSTRST